MEQVLKVGDRVRAGTTKLIYGVITSLDGEHAHVRIMHSHFRHLIRRRTTWPYNVKEVTKVGPYWNDGMIVAHVIILLCLVMPLITKGFFPWVPALAAAALYNGIRAYRYYILWK